MPFYNESYSYVGPFGAITNKEAFDSANSFASATLTRNPDFELLGITGPFLGKASPPVPNITVTRDTAGRITGVKQGVGSSPDLFYSTIGYKPNGKLDSVTLNTPYPTIDFIGNSCQADSNCPAPALCSSASVNNPGRCGVYTVHYDAVQENLTYDARGLVGTRTLTLPSSSGAAQYGYDNVGRNILLLYPDGHQRTQQFDALGRLISRCYQYTDGTPDHCYTATYDAVGNPKVLTDPDMRQEIDYDDLDRVTEVRRYVPPNVTTPAYTESYAYNALGAFSIYDNAVVDDKRPRLTGGGTASAGIPATFAGQPVTLDGGGRVTNLNGQTFGYTNFEHTLTTRTANNTKQTFIYDGLQRLIDIHVGPADDAKPTSDATYLYSDLGSSIAGLVSTPHTTSSDTPDRPNTVFRTGYDGVDHPLWMFQDGGLFYYELDAIGNVRRLHGDPHNRTELKGERGGYSYTAFGKTIAPGDPGGVAPPLYLAQPFQWQGKLLVAPGLYYSRARVWSTDLGAFLQPDEYVFLHKAGTLWSWPGQNPYRWRDPSGRDAEEWFLQNADTLANGSLALSAAAITIATGGLAGELLGLGTLEASLASAGAAVNALASRVGAAATAGAAAARSCQDDPKIEAAEIRAADLLKELNRLAAANGDPRNASQTLSDFFRANGLVDRATMLPQNVSLTPGISRDLLLSYRAVAEEVIASNLDKSGLQAARIDLIDAALSSGVQ